MCPSSDAQSSQEKVACEEEEQEWGEEEESYQRRQVTPQEGWPKEEDSLSKASVPCSKEVSLCWEEKEQERSSKG